MPGTIALHTGYAETALPPSMPRSNPEPPSLGDELTAAEVEHAYATMRDVVADRTPQSAQAYGYIAGNCSPGIGSSIKNS